MDILGRVQNGVVVFDGDVTLPEGAVVRVSCPAVGPRIYRSAVRKPVQLPLVKTGQPGSVQLTNERIGEILAAEDIEATKGQWNAPS